MFNDIPVAQVVEAGVGVGSKLMTVDECMGTPVFNADAYNNFFNGNGWPGGLQDAITKTLRRMPIRYVICDDSGSMTGCDGTKLAVTANGNHR
jgi:hypothetical protein